MGFDFNRSGGMAVSINGLLNRGRQHLCLGLGLNISTLSLGWQVTFSARSFQTHHCDADCPIYFGTETNVDCFPSVLLSSM